MIGSPSAISTSQWGQSAPTSRWQAISDLARFSSKRPTSFQPDTSVNKRNSIISIEYREEIPIAE
jgi:hypothetical protein